MRRLIVLIPEGYFVDYFVYSIGVKSHSPGRSGAGSERGYSLEWKGRIKFRGEGVSVDDIPKLVAKYSPEAVAIKVLYGGELFGSVQVYGRRQLDKLNELVPESPLHIPAAMKLIKAVERSVPAPRIILYFETGFFRDLASQEQAYALDADLGVAGATAESFRKYGYHGLLHRAAFTKSRELGLESRRIVSICLEPLPEVVGIYDGRPVTVSSGSTPLEGLSGNSNCGEIDPGIIMYLEKKKRWGPEIINNILTAKSGLTALAGERVTIADVLSGGGMYEAARSFFEYKVLLSCGAAIAGMGGLDLVAFSGRYAEAATKMAERLIARISGNLAPDRRPSLFMMQDTVADVIAGSYIASQPMEEYALI